MKHLLSGLMFSMVVMFAHVVAAYAPTAQQGKMKSCNASAEGPKAQSARLS
jgi:hypothetical protein